jgi:hypothetical protein
MATLMNRARSSSTLKSLSSLLLQTKSYAKVATGTDIISAASNVSLQKARTWDEGVASKFSTTPINDIFKVSLLSLFHYNFQYPFFIFVQLLMGIFLFFNLMLQDKKVVIFGLPVS